MVAKSFIRLASQILVIHLSEKAAAQVLVDPLRAVDDPGTGRCRPFGLEVPLTRRPFPNHQSRRRRPTSMSKGGQPHPGSDDRHGDDLATRGRWVSSAGSAP